MSYCAEHDIPVLPRGAGTSLAGQAVNRAIVLDFTRHMSAVIDVDVAERRARVQPGVTLGELNRRLSTHELKFAPDPAWGDKSTIGGAIGNNSTGAHSLIYGKTDAYVEECEVVLADGTVTRFGEVTLEELRYRSSSTNDIESRIYAAVDRIIVTQSSEIAERYPDLKRNVSGYNLDRLLTEARSGSVNLARLLAGSEGTLAIVTEATVSLVDTPRTKAVAVLLYESLQSAMEDLLPVMTHEPAAVEVLDDVLLELASQTGEFSPIVDELPENTKSMLLVEFYADSPDEATRLVTALIRDRVGAVTTRNRSGGDGDVYANRAFEAIPAYHHEEMASFWTLRKSGLPILLGRTSDEKHLAFIEDTAVPVEHLSEYVLEVQAILSDYDTFASFYAHAGPGVLHIRPLVNTRTRVGLEAIEAIADRVTDLVIGFEGSISGEHGDGRARSQWNKKRYGDVLWETFRDLKSAFDPKWLLNPGQICGFDSFDSLPDDAPSRMRVVRLTEHLRYPPGHRFESTIDPVLLWPNQNGIRGMVELCHGCGGCRGDQGSTGGVMCPTYRAAHEEITSTRGRANLLRHAMNGAFQGELDLDVDLMHEVVDLCIGCKGCARDCPSQVDMAKLKAEVTHAYHRRHGASLRDRLFANVETVYRLGSLFAPLSNWLAGAPGMNLLLERTLGIASEQNLPAFSRRSLVKWFNARGGCLVDEHDSSGRVLLYPDTYTNFVHPETGMAAIRVLETAGIFVDIPTGLGSSGRPAFSKGFLDVARSQARKNVDALSPLVDDEWDLVVIEPSDAIMLQSDYRSLLKGRDVETLADGTYGIMEYLSVKNVLPNDSVTERDERLIYHGHCHEKSLLKDRFGPAVLRVMGYDVTELDSGCCGMAGSFGYELEHYSMSQAIGDILFKQIDEAPGDRVVAPGASCRSQLSSHYGTVTPHPIEKIAEILV